MNTEMNTTLGRPLHGWCPGCRKTQTVSRHHHVEERQAAAYRCNQCGEETHEPVIRLTPPFMDAGSGLGD
jgi:predicted SprT family Zn-dependent metalloprotease